MVNKLLKTMGATDIGYVNLPFITAIGRFEFFILKATRCQGKYWITAKEIHSATP